MHYLPRKTYESLRRYPAGTRYTWTSGNQFQKRGVSKDDLVYEVSNVDGDLALLGRLTVDRILPPRETEKERVEERKKDKEFISEAPGSASILCMDITVPLHVVRKLECRTSSGTSSLTLREGKLDRQTLRTLRELTGESARLLDGYLSWPHQPRKVRRKTR
jgi:hypothetical protein